ncbi:hypothetical protein MuYL_1583 [Mucilaginibacter xinganensis]|uniref:Uncharacterized protein n=1 Tax=Mucilaginibacter xinganensis TaxID=1234841 RepID=A0A223NVB0_9SPHI|nr:hypothetical protein MuYL_1583 [Mucilaginibacter xinganensis]
MFNSKVANIIIDFADGGGFYRLLVCDYSYYIDNTAIGSGDLLISTLIKTFSIIKVTLL